MRRWIGRLALGLGLLVALGASGFVVWASTAAAPTNEALDALNSTNQVQVNTDEWLVFMPQGTPDTGFVFYPGGRVDARAYAPFAAAIAEQGYLAVIVPMPLNLAVFNINAASEVIAAYPQISTWAVGGHSLGGSMAAQFASEHAQVRGLVLWASYSATDLSAREDLEVLTVSGSRDGLATAQSIRDSAGLLPADAEFVEIAGGNHAQFGWYGAQSGDLAPQIDHAEQQRQAVEATVGLLARLTE